MTHFSFYDPQPDVSLSIIPSLMTVEASMKMNVKILVAVHHLVWLIHVLQLWATSTIVRVPFEGGGGGGGGGRGMKTPLL